MRFWSPTTYTLLTTGLIACSVYDASLLPPSDDGTLKGIGGSNTTTNGSTTTNFPTTTTIGNPMGSSGETGGSGGDGGSGGGGSNGTGGDGGSGGSATTTTDTGTGGADASQTTTSTGGASGGSPTTTDSASTTTGGVTVDPALIDDLEDGTSQLRLPNFDGYWYTSADDVEGAGEIDPPPSSERMGITTLDEPRDGSTRAMHFFGDWDGGWGAAIGFTFLSGDDPVEAAMYTGISFWVRTDVPSTIVKTQFLLTNVTDNAEYEYLLSDMVSLSADWQQVVILFDALEQPSWTTDPVAFNADNMYKVQFQFVEGQGPFDLWIDDIWFVED